MTEVENKGIVVLQFKKEKKKMNETITYFGK